MAPPQFALRTNASASGKYSGYEATKRCEIPFAAFSQNYAQPDGRHADEHESDPVEKTGMATHQAQPVPGAVPRVVLRISPAPNV